MVESNQKSAASLEQQQNLTDEQKLQQYRASTSGARRSSLSKGSQATSSSSSSSSAAPGVWRTEGRRLSLDASHLTASSVAAPVPKFSRETPWPDTPMPGTLQDREYKRKISADKK